MVRRMLYLCLDPGSSIWLGLCMDPDYTAEAGITPPPRRAPVCWHLKNQIALSSETRGVKDSGLVSGVIERENMWSLKKERTSKEIPPHPVRWGRWVSKLPPPSIPSSFFRAQAGAAESAFSRALAQIICQGKSVSNTSVSCECRKQPSTQSTACEDSPSCGIHVSLSASCSTTQTRKEWAVLAVSSLTSR